MLRDAPQIIVANAFLKALNAAGYVLEAALYEATPERDEGERSEEIIHLRDAIVTEIQLDSRFQGGTVDAGFGSEGFRALWVEYGHVMLSHDRKPTKLPRVEGKAFMLQAFEACADACIAAFSDTLEAELRQIYG